MDKSNYPAQTFKGPREPMRTCGCCNEALYHKAWCKYTQVSKRLFSGHVYTWIEPTPVQESELHTTAI